jgi:hypothetical protein
MRRPYNTEPISQLFTEITPEPILLKDQIAMTVTLPLVDLVVRGSTAAPAA